MRVVKHKDNSNEDVRMLLPPNLIKKEKKDTKRGMQKRIESIQQDDAVAKKKIKLEKIDDLPVDEDVETSESETEDENNTSQVEADDGEIDDLPVDEDVETSESETEDENNTSQVVADDGEESEKPVRGKEYSLFIGNLPPTKKASHIRTMFKKYGTILTIRFRSNDGSRLLRRKDMKKAESLICYVRFADKEQVQKACEMDGRVVDGNRIRVCPHDVKQLGSVKSTVFVGNLRKGTKDDELYDFFSPVGEIEYVRQLPNRCVAFVCFKKGVSIAKALKLHQQKLNNRPLRVMAVDPTKSNMKKNKKGHLVKRNRLPGTAGKKETAEGKKTADEFHGNVVSASKKKKGTKKPGEKANKILALKLKAAMKIKQEH